MLQIRLTSVQSVEGASGGKTVPEETVTVACPDHLILADLPVAKGLGSATTNSHCRSQNCYSPFPFGYSPLPPEGGLPFYGGPYEMARPASAPEVGAEQGPNQLWIMGPTSQGMVDGFQVRPVFFQGDYGQNMGVLASNVAPPSTNKVMESSL
ncbi:hypothetical protein Vadar_019302 [Vaccinium darrowii]|uniref:Uncharacterized protein n=1 Tax=Vaccinium darrowii TaxID=229202 RepID=A0ACB7ZK34_9ERIC|nr:hypothetical protein Vadar_019302 [Vaccinium darrowii]